MRYALLLPALLLVAACTDGFGRPPPPQALVTPGDCYEPENRLHPEWDILCSHDED